MENTKTCGTCKQVKNITEFYPCKLKKDGYRSRCKECNYLHTTVKNRNKKSKEIISLKGEVWADVKGLEGLYQVSNIGRVKGLDRYIISAKYGLQYKRQLLLKAGISQLGYKRHNLSNKDGQLLYLMVHRLVAIAYIPLVEGKDEVNHINGNKLDTRVENLEWCTGKENVQHAYDIGLNKHIGEKHGKSKLTSKQVIEIRKLKGVMMFKDIAPIYNVDASCISAIMRRITWKRLKQPK